MTIVHLYLPDMPWTWFDLAPIPEGADATWLYMERKYGIADALFELGGIVAVDPSDLPLLKASVDSLGGKLTLLGETE